MADIRKLPHLQNLFADNQKGINDAVVKFEASIVDAVKEQTDGDKIVEAIRLLDTDLVAVNERSVEKIWEAFDKLRDDLVKANQESDSIARGANCRSTFAMLVALLAAVITSGILFK
jgi:hypothetical protein